MLLVLVQIYENKGKIWEIQTTARFLLFIYGIRTTALKLYTVSDNYPAMMQIYIFRE